MPWKFSADKPIFQQLVDIITLDILNGKYPPGEKLEPVRELAVTAGVNPNTMQRALTQIEESGLIYTRRGDGRYVGEDTDAIAAVREKYAKECTQKYISQLRALGLDGPDIKQVLESGLTGMQTASENLRGDEEN